MKGGVHAVRCRKLERNTLRIHCVYSMFTLHVFLACFCDVFHRCISMAGTESLCSLGYRKMGRVRVEGLEKSPQYNGTLGNVEGEVMPIHVPRDSLSLNIYSLYSFLLSRLLSLSLSLYLCIYK